ncbi:DNA-3-methyladenine glycosylase [Crateriforma conspicua]|uniref:DNA-3-methyladenine glycosylase n=1 Tax=Crateriforma conspicua TaxID=2527996 RepID=UPI00118A0F89|nr:DNA-3-methyladenine glycosylase [Crateriforma conspicua]QDV61841.1 3-methyladenine DNA glycosylase [Crateriforma conspicua]
MNSWMSSPDTKASLPRRFYARATADVARGLLGCGYAVIRGGQWIGGLIVETEAYLSQRDAASHSARGRTPSNAAMFGPPGSLYVYPIHAKHCSNLVTEPQGIGAAVLIRAIEPVWGCETMQTLRRTDDPRRLTRGPAMLCQAMMLDRRDDGVDVVHDPSWRVWSDDRIQGIIESRVIATRRIGIRRSADRKLRFIVDGNRFVSGKAGDHRRPPRESLLELAADL